MWRDNYSKVCELEKQYGGKINKGASPAEIAKLEGEIKKTIPNGLPEKLKEVYLITEGIEFNGHILYGVDESFLEQTPNQKIHGIVDMNRVWKSEDNDFDKYLFIAEHDLSWFVYEFASDVYLELDMPSGSPTNVFDSLNSLLDKLFKRALN